MYSVFSLKVTLNHSNYSASQGGGEGRKEIERGEVGWKLQEMMARGAKYPARQAVPLWQAIQGQIKSQLENSEVSSTGISFTVHGILKE